MDAIFLSKSDKNAHPEVYTGINRAECNYARNVSCADKLSHTGICIRIKQLLTPRYGNLQEMHSGGVLTSTCGEV